MTDYKSAVKAGVQFLDSKKPGWRDLIDVETLDLAECDVCILGQIFGDYSDGKAKLGLDSVEAEKYGFNTDYSMSELTKAWTSALGENSVLVEQGDVYCDQHDYAARVLQTHIVTVNGETRTVYLVETGTTNNGVFSPYAGGSVTLREKGAFEEGGEYPIKVVPFKFKAGMLVQNKAGVVFYVQSDTMLREVKDGAFAREVRYLNTAGLREVKLPSGLPFTGIIKK